jgi:hypothetical protein
VEQEVKVLQRAFDGLTGNVESSGNVAFRRKGRRKGRGVDGEVLIWVLVLVGWIGGVGLL